MEGYFGRKRRISGRGYAFIAGFAVLVALIILFTVLIVRANKVKSVVGEFNEQYAAGNFSQARSVWNSAQKSLKGSRLNKVNDQIQQKLDAELVTLITADKQLSPSDPTVLALREFMTETQTVALNRLGDFVGEYAEKQTAFRSVWLYLLNLRTVGYDAAALSQQENKLMNHFNSRGYRSMAQQYEVSGDVNAALECYRRVIPEETEDYTYAQQRIAVLGGNGTGEGNNTGEGTSGTGSQPQE